MVIELDCPGCGKEYRLDGGLAGKKVRCKGCGHVFNVPVPRSMTAAAGPSRLDSLFDEGESAPIPPRKVSTPWVENEPASPPRARVKKPRRPVESPISNSTVGRLIGLFFGLNGLVFLGVIVGGIAGLFSSVQAGVIFGMVFMLACLAMTAIGYIGLAVVAFGEDAIQGLLCLSVPFYWIYYTATRWQAAKGMFAIGLTGLGCYLVPLILVLSLAGGLAGWRSQPGSFIARGGATPPGFAQQVDRQAAAVRGRYGDKTITILVAGLPRNGDPGRGITTSDVTTAIGERIKELVPGLQMSIGSGVNDRYALVVAPVDDPAGLASRIDFGKATLKGQTIEVTVSADFVASVEPRPQAARPSVAEFNRPAAHEPEIPRDADLITRSLLQLKSADKGMQKQALSRLQRATPEDGRRDEVVTAILPILDDDDGFFVNDAIKALAKWGNAEAVPPLIERTRDDRFNVRWEALKALGKLKDARAAEAIAERLKEDGIAAEPALKALGPLAEPALIAKLKDPDEGVRRKACDVLKVVGGLETLRAMSAIPPDPDLGVRHAAQQAYKQIVARVGPLPKSETSPARTNTPPRRRRPKI